MRVFAAMFLLCVAASAGAQQASLPKVRTLLEKKDFHSALPLITAAATHPETRNNPETWFLRGLTYLIQASEDNSASGPAAEEAYLSFKKALEIEPGYNKEIDQPLYATAILKFNTAVSLYAASFYAQAYKEFMSVNGMFVAGGVHASANAEFASLDIEARKNAAYSAINAGHDNDALTLMETLVKKDAATDPNIYLSLIEIYQASRNEEKLFATIRDAKRQFPGNELFAQAEQNYRQQQQHLLPRLEEALSKAPNDPELHNSLGNYYLRQAFPKDQRGRQFVIQPLNLTEIFSKAEKAYGKAVQLSPTNPDYQFNLGLLYYNYGRLLTNKMYPVINDTLQYRELERRRMQEFNHALPYFERSYAMLNAKSSQFAEGERTTYQNVMQILSQIYQLNGNQQKVKEMQAAIANWK